MSFCASCGRPLTPGVAFCTACGATIPEGSAAAPPLATPAGHVPAARPPVDASGIIGDSFRLVFRNFGAFLATQGVFLLLGALGALAITLLYIRPGLDEMFASFPGTDPADFEPAVFLGSLLPLLGWSALSGVVTGLLSLVGAAFGLVAADLLRAGERATPGAVWAKLRPRVGAYLSTALLMVVAIGGVLLAGFALFFLVIPIVAAAVAAVYLWLRWSLAPAAALFETHGAGENLARSTQLTKGLRGDILIVGIVAFALVAVPTMATGLAGSGFDPEAGVTTPPLWLDLVRWAVGTIAQLVSGFFLSAALVGFYRKLTG